MRRNDKEAVEKRRACRRKRLDGELQRMLELLKQHAGVQRVILFGSLAHAAATARSDVDLIVIQDTSKPFMARLDEFYRLLVPRVAADILVYTPEEWETLSSTRPFLRRVNREGKVLYASRAA